VSSLSPPPVIIIGQRRWWCRAFRGWQLIERNHNNFNGVGQRAPLPFIASHPWLNDLEMHLCRNPSRATTLGRNSENILLGGIVWMGITDPAKFIQELLCR
jgi:hypothetical protein